MKAVRLKIEGTVDVSVLMLSAARAAVEMTESIGEGQVVETSDDNGEITGIPGYSWQC